MMGMPAPALAAPPAAPAGGGWRLFSHSWPAVTGGPLPCAAPGAVFGFAVRYEDLEIEEYDLLKFALTLESAGFGPRLCHKIGYGKEHGLGSCAIRIRRDASPGISRGIGPYLADPAFRVFISGRTY